MSNSIEEQLAAEIAEIEADLALGKISAEQATEILRAARDVYIDLDRSQREKIVRMISTAITVLKTIKSVL